MIIDCIHENADWIDGNARYDEWQCKDCGETFITMLDNAGC